MATVSDSKAIAAAALRSDRFRLEREGDWQRLEAIVTRIEKGRLRKISDEDLLALPVLYRTVASSLSIARETSLDAATLAYLEGLAQRAWFQVYGPRASLGGWFKRFLGGELRLDVEAARQAVALLAGPLGYSGAGGPVALADGILSIATVIMAGAIKKVSVQHGLDPRDFVLFCYGGGGPLHASALAHELSIPSIVIPPDWACWISTWRKCAPCHQTRHPAASNTYRYRTCC